MRWKISAPRNLTTRPFGVAVEQDGRRALLRTAPGASIDPLCRALGITLPPVFQEIPPAPEPA